MLHIILLILKIIGWILLAILGLIVLLICLVLFMPAVYHGEGECKGGLDTLKASLSFSWFLHLISGMADYSDGELKWKIRIAWKKLSSEQTAPQEAEEDFNEEPHGPSRSEPVLPALSEKSIPDEPATPAIPQQNPAAPPKIKSAAPSGKALSPKPKARKSAAKAAALFKKIKYTFRKICDKIKSLLETKDKFMGLLTDEVHQKAFKKVLKELKRLLRSLKPKQLKADVLFGFEDPCITGHVLGAVSMIYPFIGAHTNIQPDFQQKILEGSLLISGKIRAVYMLSLGLRLILDKNVRVTFKHIRNL